MADWNPNALCLSVKFKIIPSTAMKKCTSFAAILVLFVLGACTPSAPVSENKKSDQSASSNATPESKSSEPAKDVKSKTDASPSSDVPAGWTEYNSAAGKFSVLMPSKPEEQSQEQKTDSGSIKLNAALAEANGFAYYTSYADFPEKFPDSEIQERLKAAITGIVGGLQGEVKSDKEVKLGENSCRDFDAVGKLKSSDVMVKGRVCFANNIRFYQVFTLGESAKFSTSGADSFISSFKINK